MTNSSILQRRLVNLDQASFLQTSMGLSPLEAQLLSARGMRGAAPALPSLLGRELKDLRAGARRVYEAIERREAIVVVADYDCDGATACAVMVAGLRALGANINYVVPDRMVHGYGISPSVVDLARERYPSATLLVTVDNGILGHSGIAHAGHLGIDVVVTDHHLPGDSLPPAVAVINPARDDCPSGLNRLAGVGVALWLVFFVKQLQVAAGRNAPPLNFLLPYLAVGTVADMVQLDETNRQLVTIGLDRMRTGQAPVGVAALIAESGLVPAYLTTQDIGFQLAPRLNAAGRLDTMDMGIELLLAQDEKQAARLAKLLSDTNAERKRKQKEAVKEASASVEVNHTAADGARSVVLGNAGWHPGIVGLVASRLKDEFFLPTFIFSLADGVAKGSGRSIPGFHLKDALEEIARRAPGVLAKFGGHAMAAGATLSGPGALPVFEQVFDAVARERIEPEMLNSVLWSDGSMPNLGLTSAARVLRHPWGQGFGAPAFDDPAIIEGKRPLGDEGIHWKVKARIAGRDALTDVVLFNQPEPPVNTELQLYLEPGLNTWRNETKLQWLGRVLN